MKTHYITRIKYDKEHNQFIIKSTNTNGGDGLYVYRSLKWCKKHLDSFTGISHNWDIIKAEHNKWFEL